MKYQQLYDGEWVTPVMRGWRMKCCGCSLIHTVNFRIRGRDVMLQATQDKRATAAARRKKK